MYTNELIHHGTKGMKWGVRRNKQTISSNVKSDKKKTKELKKSQKQWDKNVSKNGHTAYNNAAKKANDELIPKLNKKYDKYDFSNMHDNHPLKKTYDSYIKEYEDQWNALLKTEYNKMFGERPE